MIKDSIYQSKVDEIEREMNKDDKGKKGGKKSGGKT